MSWLDNVGLYDNSTADSAKSLAEENRRRLERIEAAIGIGPPPEAPPPPHWTERLKSSMADAYADAFADAMTEATKRKRRRGL